MSKKIEVKSCADCSRLDTYLSNGKHRCLTTGSTIEATLDLPIPDNCPLPDDTSEAQVAVLLENLEGEDALLIDLDYLDIPIDWLQANPGIIVCRDPQNRFKGDVQRSLTCEETWAVVKNNNNEECSEAFPEILGLFWKREQAIIFARALDHSKSIILKQLPASATVYQEQHEKMRKALGEIESQAVCWAIAKDAEELCMMLQNCLKIATEALKYVVKGEER